MTANYDMSTAEIATAEPETEPATAVSTGVRSHRWQILVDVVGAFCAALVVGAAFRPVVSTGPLAMVAGVATLTGVGLAVVWSSTRRPLLWLPPIAFLTSVVVAPLAVAHEDVVGAVLPGTDALIDSTRSLVTSWKDLLTATPPVDDDPAALFAPFWVITATSLCVGVIAMRFDRFRIAAAVTVVSLCAAVVLSGRDVAYPALIGVALLVVLVAWEVARTRVRGIRAAGGAAALRRIQPLRVAGGAVMVALAVAAGTAVAPALTAVSERTLARDYVEPPLDVRQFISPLVGYRNFRGDLRDTELFTVNQTPADGRIRVAALDAYDGVVYGSAGGHTADSGVFEKFTRARNRSGSWSDMPVGAQTSMSVTIGDYTGVWVPGLFSVDDFESPDGVPDGMRDNLYYNPAASTLVTNPALSKEDSYIVHGHTAVRPTDEEIGQNPVAPVVLPAPEVIPETVATTAAEITAGLTTDLEKVRAIESFLHGEGFYSSGQRGEVRSRAGHNADRIAVLLEGEQMIGDEEQYAVAMTLMARALGMPARVVMGFELPDDTASNQVNVTGDMATAWVEIPFDEIGWVEFAPTPDRDRRPEQLAPEPKTSPKPKSIQPPPPPQQSVELVAASAAGGGDEERNALAWLWAVLLDIAILLGRALLIAMLLAFVPALIIVAKHRRRQRRRSHADPRTRILGGWDELVDMFVDLGAAQRRGATRRDIADQLAQAYPSMAVRPLAGGADAVAFALGTLTTAQSDAYWAEVDRVRNEVRQATAPPQWWRSQVSVRSFFSDDAVQQVRRRSDSASAFARAVSTKFRRSDEREWVQ